MAYTFQGVSRLALIFQQLSIGSVAVSTVTGLEAAAKYPPLVVGTSSVFFLIAGKYKQYIASSLCLILQSGHTSSRHRVLCSHVHLTRPLSLSLCSQL
jgi:hypothetical protein